MEHGQLYDLDTVKILVIYTLNAIQRAVPTSRIYDIFLNSELVDYFTLAQSIDSLKETGHITVDEESSIIVITRLGVQASQALYTQVPSYARDRAVKGALDMLNKIELQAGVSTRTDFNNQKYTTTCIVKDGTDELMKIEFVVADKETGLAAEKKFTEKSSQIYKMIIEELL